MKVLQRNWGLSLPSPVLSLHQHTKKNHRSLFIVIANTITILVDESLAICSWTRCLVRNRSRPIIRVRLSGLRLLVRGWNGRVKLIDLPLNTERALSFHCVFG